jgi:hypothetical protein
LDLLVIYQLNSVVITEFLAYLRVLRWAQLGARPEDGPHGGNLNQ